MTQHEYTERLLDEATGFYNARAANNDAVAEMIQRQREFAHSTLGRREYAWLARLESLAL